MSRVARRRAVLAGVIIGLVAIAVVLLSGGSDARMAIYQPRGLVSQTLEPVRTVPVRPARAAMFIPSPRARSLAQAMSLEQQVAALLLPAVPLGSDLSATLAGAPWGGVVILPPTARNGGDTAAGSADQTASADASTASGILRGEGQSSPLIGMVQPGGSVGVLPADAPISQRRQAHDPTGRASGANATEAASLLRRLGYSLVLAPEADVNVPQGPLTERLFGTDPELVARLSRAAVVGYTKGGLIAAAGHFPGQGAASADPDLTTATVGGSLADLLARDLRPFRALATDAPIVQMSNAAYAAFDGVTPATLLPQAVALLRTQLGFGGVVMSGDLDASAQMTGQDAGGAALRALAAGNDLLLLSGTASERRSALQAVVNAARRQPVLASEVHNSLLRVLTLKDRFGLLR